MRESQAPHTKENPVSVYHCSRTQGRAPIPPIPFTYSFTGQIYSIIIISHSHDARIEAGLWMAQASALASMAIGHAWPRWQTELAGWANVANENPRLRPKPSGPSAHTASWEPLWWNAFTGNIPCHSRYAATPSAPETAVAPTIYTTYFSLPHCIYRLLIFISSHSCWPLVGFVATIANPK